MSGFVIHVSDICICQADVTPEDCCIIYFTPLHVSLYEMSSVQSRHTLCSAFVLQSVSIWMMRFTPASGLNADLSFKVFTSTEQCKATQCIWCGCKDSNIEVDSWYFNLIVQWFPSCVSPEISQVTDYIIEENKILLHKVSSDFWITFTSRPLKNPSNETIWKINISSF